MSDELKAVKANAEEFKVRYEAVVEKLGQAQERIEELEAEKKELEDKCNEASDVLGLIMREAKAAWLKF